MLIATAGISILPFASQVKFIANVANNIVPARLNSLSNLVLKRNPNFYRHHVPLFVN